MKYLLFFMKHLAGIWQDQGISKSCHLYAVADIFLLSLMESKAYANQLHNE